MENVNNEALPGSHAYPEEQPDPVRDKINAIFEKQQIRPEDVKDLNAEEMEEYICQFHEKLESPYGNERERFANQVELVASPNARNSMWEHNHQHITQTVSIIMSRCGRMPATNEIAEATGLSRETIRKHLREYSKHPLYLEEMERFRLMSSNVLAMAYKMAEKGNARAAKLYLDTAGPFKNLINNTVITTQNNLQINNTTITQDQLQHLSPDQRTAIENILKAALPPASQENS